MLRGRRAERARLEDLVAQAREGRSGALVVRGPPGAGKSELLAYAASMAGDLKVLHASGAHPERDLSFAVLHQLLRPALHRLTALPPMQRRALEGALALGPATAADRFVVSAAVLSLLAEYATTSGLLCLLDDAHWCDRASLDALLFSARRLENDGVALLLAARDEESDLEQMGIPTIAIAGLDHHSAKALVVERAGVPVAESVVVQLMRATAGNPLALSELARLLTPGQLRGEEPLPEPPPMSSGLENAFLAQARELPDTSQLLLLLAAAEGTGDIATILAAAATLKIPLGALDAAEAAKLVTVLDGGLAFRHPLVRSALYGGAKSSQRRQVHLALASVLDRDVDIDRRVWHQAAATVSVDDRVADALAASADRARQRSGYAGAAAALHRSAALTTDADVRARRLLDSAQDAWLAGRPESTYSCLLEAQQLTTDPDLLTESTRLRARCELRRGTATDAFQLFLDAAIDVAERSPQTAVEILGEASEAALYVGDIEGMIRVGNLARGMPVPEGSFWADFCVGVADVLDGRMNEAEPRLRRVLEWASTASDPWHLVSAGVAAVWLGDWASAFAFYEKAALAARVADMTGNLPYVLEYLAVAERTRGRYATSEAISEEGLRLSRETGQESSTCNHLANLAHLAALAGEESSCRDYAREALDRALPRRLGFPAARASLALAMLDLGAGRFREALTRLTQLAGAQPGSGHPAIVLFSLPERIEAAVRCGDREAAEATLKELEGWNVRSGPAAMAVVMRCRAMLAQDDDVAALLSTAMRLHAEGASPPPEVARTQLVYGEWLRRARRPAESRQHLREALEIFDRLGCTPWADRARVELKASGETMRDGEPTSQARLTPQELRIARAVAGGSSTKEIAALLFLSPRTVEYHLHKLFPKLGISNRMDLVRLVSAQPELIEG